jgi:hypothetical protein
MGRDVLDDTERAELAAFLAWAERQWKDRGNAESRRAFEKHLRDANADYGMLVVWRGQHDELAARLDVAVKQATGHANRALSRVAAAYREHRGRKTMPVSALRIALGQCEGGMHDAEHEWRGYLYCGPCLAIVTELARPGTGGELT